MSRKKLLNLSLVVALFVGLGAITKSTYDYFEISKNMEILGEVYNIINRDYVDETDPTGLMRTGIDAMLGSLDPYTNYYSGSQIQYSRLMSSGQYIGIGAEVGRRDGKVLVLELFGDGPADKAGIKVGDEVLQIDDIELDATLSVDQINSLLLGEKGTEVTLEIVRNPDAPTESIPVQRGGSSVVDEQNENVPYFGLVNDKTGYILLSAFVQDAGKEVGDALSSLKEQAPELESVVLDLRGNPGGRLDEAVNVVNNFVNAGVKLVEMKGRTPESQNVFFTRRAPIDTDIRLAVLINKNSASASEIVSGSIQDLDRGVIVGQRSFGKGLVQNVRPLDPQNQMKITVAKYYIPSGRCVQAIDYAHRSADGSVGRVPDSLTQAFQTKNGRTVFDGRGVDPDLEVPKPDPQAITQALDAQNLIFNFVTEFAAQTDSVAPPREFELTDAIYGEFVAFVGTQELSYETDTERQLKRFDRIVHQESYGDELNEGIEALRASLQSEKAQDVERHKAQIAPLLKREIINRYYFKQGVIEASFEDDPDMLKALEILADVAAYEAVLQ